MISTIWRSWTAIRDGSGSRASRPSRKDPPAHPDAAAYRRAPFLFHGYDPRPRRGRPVGARCRAAWSGTGTGSQRYGVIYVGHNWQRRTQLQRFLEAIEPMATGSGPFCLAGWRWDQRHEWAVEHGIAGVDVDPALLGRLGVETEGRCRSTSSSRLTSPDDSAPVFHRPLFNQLGLVTNRTSRHSAPTPCPC